MKDYAIYLTMLASPSPPLRTRFSLTAYSSIVDALSAYEHRDAVLSHTSTYGIDDIGYLFPDARTTTNAPAFIKRDTEWVSKVFGAAKTCTILSV